MRWTRPEPEGEIAEDLAAMRRYARALTRDAHDADDVVQDAMVRAIERQRTFQPGRSRRQWLMAIVHNVFISLKRRDASEARRNDRFAETLMAHIGPEQDERVRLAQVARRFAALPEHHRAVLHLIAVEGLSYQAAAETLDVPVGTVMSRLARARGAMCASEQEPRPTALRVVGDTDA